MIFLFTLATFIIQRVNVRQTWADTHTHTHTPCLIWRKFLLCHAMEFRIKAKVLSLTILDPPIMLLLNYQYIRKTNQTFDSF